MLFEHFKKKKAKNKQPQLWGASKISLTSKEDKNKSGDVR